jgi:hypothetical protein
MKALLEQEWADYRARIPADLTPVLEVECRRAFYAGACAFHRLYLTLNLYLLEVLDALTPEVREFAARFYQRGKL